jgi:hypothetical protein
MTRTSATTHQMDLPKKRQQPMGSWATTRLERCLGLPQEVRKGLLAILFRWTTPQIGCMKSVIIKCLVK